MRYIWNEGIEYVVSMENWIKKNAIDGERIRVLNSVSLRKLVLLSE